jgi:hypothetical protein
MPTLYREEVVDQWAIILTFFLNPPLIIRSDLSYGRVLFRLVLFIIFTFVFLLDFPLILLVPLVRQLGCGTRLTIKLKV